MNKNIIWFRQDLRLTDNPALFTASNNGDILPIYIIDENTPQYLKLGEASNVWLHHALKNLNELLKGKLQVFIGDPLIIIPDLIKKYSITQVYWNRCYDSYQIKRDTILKTNLKKLKIDANSYNGSLLWEPWEVLKADKTPYKVFTPFYQRGCLQQKEPRTPLPIPQINFIDIENTTQIDNLKLLPKIRWDISLTNLWDISESGAFKQLEQFYEHAIVNYKNGRNFPAQEFTSKLSPYLHFGQISPNTAWYKAKSHGYNDNTDCFLSELGWREFSYYILYYFPELHSKNLQSKFDKFPWGYDENKFIAWRLGKTGFPIIDAGMRELWQTGYMHNRVRMIVASFLVKNLLIDWRYGASWFLNTLFDADIASNSASWQWVAGSGADAQPYFRIFNPITQSEKFDPDGNYIKKYVPELKNLNTKYISNPSLAPEHELIKAKIKLGEDYPYQIVNLSESRKIALESLKSISY